MLRRRVRRRVRAWGRRRDRAVVDDATASRHLPLHQPERLLGAEERSGEVGVDDRLPLVDVELFERDGGGADARVVEEQVEPAVAVVDLGEERPDRGGVGDIARDRHGVGPGRRGGGFERLDAPSCEDDGPALTAEGEGDRGADAAAGSGDECDPRHGRATRCLLRATRSKLPIIGLSGSRRRSGVGQPATNCESPGQEGVPRLSPVCGDGSSASCPSLDPISSVAPRIMDARVESQLRVPGGSVVGSSRRWWALRRMASPLAPLGRFPCVEGTNRR